MQIYEYANIRALYRVKIYNLYMYIVPSLSGFWNNKTNKIIGIITHTQHFTITNLCLW